MHSLMFSTCFLLFSTVAARLSITRPPAQANNQQSYVLSNGNSTTFTGDDPAELVKRDGTKYVFMHHIVGTDWADDIRQIQAKGIDAIALNIGSSDWQRGQIASAYAAAVGSPLKLFISFDFTEMPCDVADVVSRTNQWVNHPNQFKVNGKTMISSFSGDCFGNNGWQAIKDQTNGYLMPFIPNLEGKFSSWPSLDSWLCWGCAWPQGDYTKNTDDDNYYISQLGTRYSATISPWFYTHYNYKNIVYNSDNWLLVTRWEQLMSFRNTITFAELVSWNDYGESHHMGPVKGAMPSGTNWVNGLPHTAWFDMSQYYITAFQTGSYPAITKDVIYFWARTHPVAATASSDSLGKPSGWNWVQDTLWAVVFATSPGSVTLTSGTNTQTFSVNAGVNKLKLPLSPGKITVSMTKNGQVIINYSPAGYTFITNPVTYNYNAYVDSASAVVTPPSSTSSATPTSSSGSAAPTSTSLSYAPLGCYVDPGDARVLNGGMTSSSSQTVAGCASSCAAQGFAYFGTEYGSECWCGSAIRAGASTAPSSDCSTPCSGKSSDICGNGNRLSLYRFGASTSSSVTSSPTPTSTSSSATPTSTSISYSSLGCYNDPAEARVLNGGMTSSSSQTIASCAASCAAQGSTYFGTEYGNECWCGSSIRTGATVASSGDCSMPCAGKASDICGSSYRLSLYKLGSSTSSTTVPTSSPTPTSSTITSSAISTSTRPSSSAASTSSASPTPSFAYAGCYVDSSNARILNGGSTTSSTLSVNSCISSCSARGFVYAGTEYGKECWCGSVLASGAARAAESDCKMTCSGQASDICGGSNRMSLYRLSSGTSSSSPAPSSSAAASSTSRASTSSTSSTATSASSTTSATWTYVGCVAEGTTGSRRALTGPSYTRADMTPALCQSLCTGYDYSGTENGSQCEPTRGL
ncbi:hypothetical protein PC9H_000583 [Pleurotus ostreatus]|uniref:WSC domain-containing protein n=1 Tax=Pleurotus ostreatus TaxID=5322 RepID=A0A8H7DVE5_PLEOS|nr:uncharacterized protein PC9H_000583 [Pleurotus ostreatus]KAF7440239.1 hypothetical protein PC9H_000583 [Pleurotus ostreatus]